MVSPGPLQYGCIYHIYNRGNNHENVFYEERNYHHFLRLYARYVLPVADTYAYCLLRNHFHFLVRIKTTEEQEAYQETQRVQNQTHRVKVRRPSQQFSNLFNAYAKAINRAYERTGSLFENPFGRVLVSSDTYFCRLITYIHQNPQKHGFVDDLREWPFSSYHAILSSKQTKVARQAVLDWFGGADAFRAAHKRTLDDGQIAPLVPDDFD
jgi:REP element-mobilizing transposase RayT